MAQIYSDAERVLIHLGSDDDVHGPAFSSLLTELDTMIQSTLDKIGSTWNYFPFLEKGEQERLMLDGRWKSFDALLSQPWFTRGWVVQEAGLA